MINLKNLKMVIVLLSGPALLTALSPSWLLTGATWQDGWTYANSFREFGSLNVWASEQYKSSRVTWVLLGQVSFRFFGVLGGQFVLALVCMLYTIVVSYLLLKRVAPHTRIFGSILISMFPLLHGLGGWLYHNSLAIPLYLTLIYLGRLLIDLERLSLLRMAKFVSFGFGFAMVILVVTATDSLPGVFFLCISIGWIMFRRQCNFKKLLLFISSLGVLTAVAVCSGFGLATGVGLMFLRPIVNSYSDLVSESQLAAFRRPIGETLSQASYLIPTVISGVVVAWVLTTRLINIRRVPKKSCDRLDDYLVTIFVVTTIGQVGYQVATNGVALLWPWYSAYLIISSLLILISLVESRQIFQRSLGYHQWLGFALAIVAGLMIGGSLEGRPKAELIGFHGENIRNEIFGVVISGMLLLVICVFFRPHLKWGVLLSAVIACTSFSSLEYAPPWICNTVFAETQAIAGIANFAQRFDEPSIYLVPISSTSLPECAPDPVKISLSMSERWYPLGDGGGLGEVSTSGRGILVLAPSEPAALLAITRTFPSIDSQAIVSQTIETQRGPMFVAYLDSK